MSTQSVCNICGANYEYRNGRWKCPACGAFKAEELSNEEVTLLYNAAQKLRLSNFSEAEEEYADIIEKYPSNANAYWGRLLSKYGIKYEEDFDGRKIPTCYATSIESVMSDSDYLKAIEFADDDTRKYFTQQAEYIERVRQEWINKAQKEKPYDVFICYKDSDLEKGIERTEDSINAQEIYIHLIEQGYRVFFSRESLRDKVGEKYEPYIFNALSTSKVMLVYGSSAEYIKSTWLKNEWHRYYKKIVSGEKHQESLIVACDGFSPSELPTILSSRQCLDAKRKAFFSDLDKCIRRIIDESTEYAAPMQKKKADLISGLHEHSYKTKVVKATCIAKGYTIHKCDCGYEYRDTYTPLVDHKFKIIGGVEPTCTTDGREDKTCEICGESISTKLPALNHQFTKWIEIKHPTCTEDGEEQRQCTRCGHTEHKTINKTEHNFGGWTINPDGTQTSYCQNCGIGKTEIQAGTKQSIPISRQSKIKAIVSHTALLICALLAFLLFYSIFGLTQLKTLLNENIQIGGYDPYGTYADMQQITITTLVLSLIQLIALFIGTGYWDKNYKHSLLVLNSLSALSFVLSVSLLWVQIDVGSYWSNYSYYINVAMVISVINFIASAIQFVFSIASSFVTRKNGNTTGTKPKNTDIDSTTISFSGIFRNWILYSKSFFNSETTKAQKGMHYVGWSVILSFMTMFGTIGFSSKQGEPAATITVVAGVWMFANIPFAIWALLARLIERTKCKQNNLPMNNKQYSRLGFKIISNWLLMICSMWVSLGAMPEESSRPAIMFFFICVIWSFIMALYAHCPKQYKKISIGNNTVMKRYCLTILGITASVICLIIMFSWIAAVTG